MHYDIRPYREEDEIKVLELFRLNTPEFFALDEERDLIHYLHYERFRYFVVAENDRIIGSGGMNLKEQDTIGVISWDLIHPDFQGKGIGRKLLEYRLKCFGEISTVQKINVRTSQFVFRFYEKADFKLIGIVSNYWSLGYDLYTMEKDLAD